VKKENTYVDMKWNLSTIGYKKPYFTKAFCATLWTSSIPSIPCVNCQHLWQTKQKSQQWLYSSQRFTIMAQMNTKLSWNSYLSIPPPTLAHFQEWGQCDIVVASTKTKLNSSKALDKRKLTASILFWVNS
jgi:hypothetical protein